MPTVLRGLSALAAAAYILAAILGIIFEASDDTSGIVIWVVLLLGGGLLILVGLRTFTRSPWLGAVVLSVGAAAGALALVWSIIAPIAAIVLIVLSVLYARRLTGPAATAG